MINYLSFIYIVLTCCCGCCLSHINVSQDNCCTYTSYRRVHDSSTYSPSHTYGGTGYEREHGIEIDRRIQLINGQAETERKEEAVRELHSDTVCKNAFK